MNAKVKPGYKQSEVGVIPEDSGRRICRQRVLDSVGKDA